MVRESILHRDCRLANVCSAPCHFRRDGYRALAPGLRTTRDRARAAWHSALVRNARLLQQFWDGLGFFDKKRPTITGCLVRDIGGCR